MQTSSTMPTICCDGLLFIGDPHLSARRPGRRTDEDWRAVCLGKLGQALGLAAEGNLQPVILGDLFDRAREMDALLLGSLFAMLARCPLPPFCLAGNHDLSESFLTPETSLAVVRATGLLRVVDRPGPFLLLDIGGTAVGLGGTPNGMEIPEAVDWPAEVRRRLWITHEDLAFPGAYPGAKPFLPIRGVEAVVNGHMHLAQKPVMAGATEWRNPGNILRLSVDAKGHVPAVTSWTPAWGFKTVPLDHGKDVFNLSGKEAAGAMPLADLPPSLFAELMTQEMDGGEAAATEDGGLLREEIEALAAELKAEDAVRKVVMRLLEVCVDA